MHGVHSQQQPADPLQPVELFFCRIFLADFLVAEVTGCEGDERAVERDRALRVQEPSFRPTTPAPSSKPMISKRSCWDAASRAMLPRLTPPQPSIPRCCTSSRITFGCPFCAATSKQP